MKIDNFKNNVHSYDITDRVTEYNEFLESMAQTIYSSIISNLTVISKKLGVGERTTTNSDIEKLVVKELKASSLEHFIDLIYEKYTKICKINYFEMDFKTNQLLSDLSVEELFTNEQLENISKVEPGIKQVICKQVKCMIYHTLCFLVRYWKPTDIVNNNFCKEQILNFDLFTEISQILRRVDRHGYITVMDVLKYHIIVNNKIVHTKPNEQGQFTEYSRIDWISNNSLTALVNTYHLQTNKDNETTLFCVSERVNDIVFGAKNSFSKICKTFTDGTIYSPYNAYTSHTDTRFKGIDAFNTYVPRFTPDNALKSLNEENTQLIRKQIYNFRQLIRLNCGDDDAKSEFLENYFAHLIQKPFELMDYIVILCGNAGSGKSTICATIGDCLGFNNHAKITPNFENIVGNYNSALADKVLHIKDELGYNKQGDEELRANLEKLKDITTVITAYPIADKFIKSANKYIYPHILITTNNVEMFHPEAHERRQVLIQGVDNFRDDPDYLKIVTEYMSTRNELFTKGLYEHFLQDLYLYFTNRTISISDFAHAYESIPWIKEVNSRFTELDITRKYAVVSMALKDLINDIDSSQVSLTSRLSLNPNLLQQLQIRVYGNNFSDNKADNIMIQKFESMMGTEKTINDDAMQVLCFYMRNVLESMPTLRYKPVFASLYDKQGRTVDNKRVLSAYIKDFIEQYKDLNILYFSDKTKKRFACYRLNHDYKSLVNKL